jgi:nucleoside-diphosphate-sugar epimerase
MPLTNSPDGGRIFLAGASGIIGQRLIPLLVQAGHVVGGMTISNRTSC